MLDELLQFIPAEPGTTALITAMAGVVVGATLWLLGTKFSRPLVTLLTVLLGAAVGMQLPRWVGWQISGAGPAVGVAVVLGVSGFILHRMWVGIGLGAVLALWVTMAVWLAMHGTLEWNWPDVDRATTIWSFLTDAWSNVPLEMARIIGFASAAALVSGVAAAILWPKLTTVLNWSWTGVSLLAVMGVATMWYGRPRLLANLPQDTWAQLAALLAMVAIGATIQWQLSPAPAGAAGGDGASAGQKSKKPKQDKGADD